MERALLDWMTREGDVVGVETVRWLVTGDARLPMIDVGWARLSDDEAGGLRW